MNKLKKIFLISVIILGLDFILSNLLFKKMQFWSYEKLVDHYWRIPSDIYHHDLMPNINVIEPWGFSLKKKLITNSLGFRDFEKKGLQNTLKRKDYF